jgi:hypothetical protein
VHIEKENYIYAMHDKEKKRVLFLFEVYLIQHILYYIYT